MTLHLAWTPSARRVALLAAGVALIAAACTSAGATQTPSVAPTGNPTPTTAASATATASTSPAESSSASAGTNQVTVATSATKGAYLAGEGGKALYVFDKDAAGATTSACSGQCATTWPAFTLKGAEQVSAGSGVTGTLAVVTLSDGTRQVAYKGHLVYYYAGDQQAGDTNGDGIGGIWHLAKP